MSKLTDVWDSFSEGETPEDAWDSVGNEDFQDVSLEAENTVESAKTFAEETADEIAEGVDEADDLDELLDEAPRRRRGLFDDDDDDDFDDVLDEEKRPRKKNNGWLTILIVVLAIAVIVAAVIFIAKKLSSSTGTTTETSETSDADWEKNTNSEVLSLMNKYYAARVQNDTYTLTEILDPTVTIDEETLKNEQNVVEGYQNIECHTTEGLKENSWAVYVTYDLKFKNISTAAPGLSPAYVYTDESGVLRLIPADNLASNADVQDYILKVSKTEYITKLVEEVDNKYQKAVASDSALNAYIVSLGGEGAETQAETTAAESTSATVETSATATTAATETTAAATTAASTTAASGSETFTDYDNEMFVTKDSVRVRSTPSTASDDNIVKTLPKGQTVYTTGKSDNWYRVCLSDGSTAYIAKDFLSSDKPQ